MVSVIWGKRYPVHASIRTAKAYIYTLTKPSLVRRGFEIHGESVCCPLITRARSYKNKSLNSHGREQYRDIGVAIESANGT